VSVYLPPIEGPAAAPEAPPALTARPSPVPATILVVEDEAVVRDLLVAELQDVGYEVIAADAGEPALEGWAWIFEGLVEMFGGSAERASRNFEEGQRLHRELGVRVGEARAAAAIGLTFMLAKDAARAQTLVQDALELAVAVDDSFGQGQCHTYLGLIAESRGDPRAATSHYRSAVACLRPFRDVTLLPTALVGQAHVLAQRDPATALRVAAAASAARARVGGEFPPLVQAYVDEVRRHGEAAPGVEEGRVWKEGLHLDLDDAIALAFGAPRPRSVSVDGLSEREREVALLAARGLSNKEIAAHLHVSVRTVESHIRHVLTKVGLVNRTQLANWMRQRNQ
jgi:non-specific serine/threonine protein kinase